MKEKDFKRILMESEIDDDIDKRIQDNLLSFDPKNKLNSIPEKLKLMYRYNKIFRLSSKAAAIILVLFAIGGTSAWAAALLVKTEPVTIVNMTEEEFNKRYEEKEIDREESLQKYNDNKKTKVFGGDRYVSNIYDSEGNLIELRGDNGSIYYGSDTDLTKEQLVQRHRQDREISAQAFAELGLPNLIPDYIYDNYLISPNGIVLTEFSDEGHTVKNIMVCFCPDYRSSAFNMDINNPLDIYKRVIWVTISSAGEVKLSNEVITLREELGTISNYTNKNGINCTIEEDDSRILVHIHFSSEDVGNGSIMMEFHDTPKEKVYEILDMLPIIEDVSYELEDEE